MDEEVPGGKAGVRLQDVLTPSFVEGLEDLPLEELRRRRDRVLAEREFQSYLRRLIQVRFDVLASERARRRQGGETPPLVEHLTEVMAEGPRGAGRGEALRLGLPAGDIEEAERRAEELVGDARDRDPSSLENEELDRALELLERHERAVSADRTAVMRVHDRLQDELKRRFREDPSLALR